MFLYSQLTSRYRQKDDNPWTGKHKNRRPILKITKAEKCWEGWKVVKFLGSNHEVEFKPQFYKNKKENTELMAQVVECLPSKCKELNQYSCNVKKKE